MQRDAPLTPDDIVAELLDGYRRGAFPMASIPDSPRTRRQAWLAADDPARPLPRGRWINWYAPDPRAILPLEPGGLHIPRRLQPLLRRSPFIFTSDRCFERVIRACARPRSPHDDDEASGLWLDETIAQLYTLLHEHGHTHSIEAWLPEPGFPVSIESVTSGRARLVGGLYGVHLAGLFCAESMFSRPEHGGSNASTLALVHLVHHLRAQRFSLLDVQMANPHTSRFGVVEIPRAEYESRLTIALERPASWGTFTPPAHSPRPAPSPDRAPSHTPAQAPTSQTPTTGAPPDSAP